MAKGKDGRWLYRPCPNLNRTWPTQGKNLQVEEEARKNAESTSEGYQKQVEEQARLLREANAELKKTQEQALVLRKHLEETQKLRE